MNPRGKRLAISSARGGAALARLGGALVLLVILGLSAFGFLATFEYSDASERLPWQIGYGLLALGSVTGAALLFRCRSRSAT